MSRVASVANPLGSAELVAFVAAAEAGSVHGAAETLQLTQSAVTKRIQAPERRVGGRLFERGRFGVRPTELGRTVYPPASARSRRWRALSRWWSSRARRGVSTCG